MLKSAESTFNIALRARYRVIAVVGLFDKGKTFLINKLFGVNLPSGKLFTTKGLSFLYVKERRMLIIDSAGVQATVSHREQARPRQDIEAVKCTSTVDAQTTESLLFEMISAIAHHLIFVVNDFTWLEQKYVTMLHQKYVNQAAQKKNQAGQSKELLVVHNLRFISTISEARKIFEKQITSCYDGVQSHLGELIYHADQGDGRPVHHWGLCDDATPAGEHFNPPNIDNIGQKLEVGNALGSYIELPVDLSSQFQRVIPFFASIVSADGGTGTMDGNDAINQQIMAQYKPVEEGVPVSEDGYQVAGSVELQPPSGSRLVIKKCGVRNSLGEEIVHDVSFDPRVNVFDKENCRIIEVECPRVTMEEIKWEETPNGVKVIIHKPKAFDEAKIKEVYPIRQDHGLWEQEFDFPKEQGLFKLSEDYDAPSLKNGVLTIVLHRKGRVIHRLGLPCIQESTQFASPHSYDYGMQAASNRPHLGSYVSVPNSTCSESTEMSC
jgi:HSP20 family molecular chaperone IbpA